MVVKIRFARFGPRHSPFYNIVVAQARYVIPIFRDPVTYYGPGFMLCLFFGAMENAQSKRIECV